jgi:aldehyde dehydrogenase (NAD+)
MTEKFFMTIDNEACGAQSGETLESLNPYTQQVWAEFPAATEADVDKAVRAAHKAFREGWWRHDARRRATALERLAAVLDAKAARLADIEAKDCGKLLREARGVTGVTGSFLRYGASLARSVSIGEIQSSALPGLECQTVRQPYGVIAVQVPWNNPTGVFWQESTLALAAGNTIVVKPSEFASCSILALNEAIKEADIPPGVINIVSGLGPLAGAALCAHPLVRKIIFTGGGPAAKIIARQAAERFVPLVLELGGKSATLVFDDANLDAAARGILGGFTGGTGQSCIANSRVLVHRPVYDEFVAKLVNAASGLVLGDPFDPDAQVGPLISKEHFGRVAQKVRMALDEGAELLCGGGRPADPKLAGCPLFFEPTVFKADPAMRIAREEVFGPVAVVIPFEDEKEAVAIANDSDYGLAAGVWSTDINRVHRLTRELYAGTVWVNSYRVGDPAFPFGGVKESGYGRECGIDGYNEMTYVKSIRLVYEAV